MARPRSYMISRIISFVLLLSFSSLQYGCVSSRQETRDQGSVAVGLALAGVAAGAALQSPPLAAASAAALVAVLSLRGRLSPAPPQNSAGSGVSPSGNQSKKAGPKDGSSGVDSPDERIWPADMNVSGRINGEELGAAISRSGSGENKKQQLSVMRPGGSDWDRIDTVALGDGEVHSVSVKDDEIVVRMTRYESEDGRLGPTRETIRKFTVIDGRIVMTAEENAEPSSSATAPQTSAYVLSEPDRTPASAPVLLHGEAVPQNSEDARPVYIGRTSEGSGGSEYGLVFFGGSGAEASAGYDMALLRRKGAGWSRVDGAEIGSNMDVKRIEVNRDEIVLKLTPHSASAAPAEAAAEIDMKYVVIGNTLVLVDSIGGQRRPKQEAPAKPQPRPEPEEPKPVKKTGGEEQPDRMDPGKLYAGLTGSLWRWSQTTQSRSPMTFSPDTRFYAVQFSPDGSADIMADCGYVGGFYSLNNNALAVSMEDSAKEPCRESQDMQFLSDLSKVDAALIRDHYLYLHMESSGTMKFSVMADLSSESGRSYAAEKWIGRADREYSEKNFRSALKCLARAAALKPNSSEVLQRKALVNAIMGKYSEAEADYASALLVKPGDPEIGLALAELQIMKGDYAEALKRISALSGLLKPSGGAVAAYLECSAKKMLDMNVEGCDAAMAGAAGGYYRVAWPFDAVEVWLSSASIPADKKEFILGKIRLLKK